MEAMCLITVRWEIDGKWLLCQFEDISTHISHMIWTVTWSYIYSIKTKSKTPKYFFFFSCLPNQQDFLIYCVNYYYYQPKFQGSSKRWGDLRTLYKNYTKNMDQK